MTEYEAAISLTASVRAETVISRVAHQLLDKEKECVQR